MNEQLPVDSALSRAENFKANFRLIRQREIISADPSASPQEKSVVILTQATVNFYDAPVKAIQSILPLKYQTTTIEKTSQYDDLWAIEISHNTTPCGKITVTANNEKIDISYSHSTLAVFFNQKPDEEFPVQNWTFVQEEQRLRLCLNASYNGIYPEARSKVKTLIEGNPTQPSMLEALCDWREKYQFNSEAIELLTNILNRLRILLNDPVDQTLLTGLNSFCTTFEKTYGSAKIELSQASGEKSLKGLLGVSLVFGGLAIAGIVLTYFIPMEELLKTTIFWTSAVALTLALGVLLYASNKLCAEEPSKFDEADTADFKGRDQTQIKDKDPSYAKFLSSSIQIGDSLSSFLSQQIQISSHKM